MLIWGWSTKNIGSYKVSGICSRCRTDNLFLVGYQKTFDLFFVPTIPLSQSSNVVCSLCQTAYSSDFCTSEELSQLHTPWWSFSGLIFVGFMMLLATIANAHQPPSKPKEEINLFKNKPEIGSYFVFKMKEKLHEDTPYGFAKIEQFDEEVVTVRPGRFLYSDKSMACSDAQKSKNGTKETLDQRTLQFSSEELTKMSIDSILKG